MSPYFTAQTGITDRDIIRDDAFVDPEAVLTVHTNIIRFRPVSRGVVVMCNFSLFLLGEILLSFFVGEWHHASYIA